VDKLIEIHLMTFAKVNESLHRLVGISRYILPLTLFYHGESIIGEVRKASGTAVDIRRFIDAHEGLIENCEGRTAEE
jgi:hypothetical protein